MMDHMTTTHDQSSARRHNMPHQQVEQEEEDDGQQREIPHILTVLQSCPPQTLYPFKTDAQHG